MRADLKEIQLAHQLDIAWIIALWHWIHDGDPAPEGLIDVDHETIGLAVALSEQLTRTAAAGHRPQLTFSRLQGALTALGVEVTEGGLELRGGAQVEAIDRPQTPDEPPPYCFHFKEQTICVPRKRVQYTAGT